MLLLAPGQRGREVEDAQAIEGRVRIDLAISQISQDGQVELPRNASRVAAARVRGSTRTPSTPTKALFFRTVFSSIRICRKALVAAMSNTDGWTGTSDLPGVLQRVRQALAMQARGRIDHQPVALPLDAAWVVLAPVEANDARHMCRPHGEPGQGRLLSVQIPQQDFVLQTRKRAGQVGGYCSLPRTTLRIDDQYRAHGKKISTHQ